MDGGLDGRSYVEIGIQGAGAQNLREIESSGEPVIVTDHGRPAIEIRSAKAAVENPFEILRNSVVWHDTSLAPVDADEWEVPK